jgi:hypothetical protein
MDALRSAEASVNTLESLSLEITDEQERRAFRRHLAEVMIGYVDIQMSIVRQYPDLDPDRRLSADSAGEAPGEPGE